MEIFINILTAALTLGVCALLVGLAIALLHNDEKKETADVAAQEEVKLRAFVKCNGKDCEKKYTYADVEDCAIANLLAAGPDSCGFSCMGLGSCVNICPEKAISVEDGIAVVSEEKCTGCGACVDICPRGIIELVPEDKKFRVKCSGHKPGERVETRCENGCIGCGTCVNTCEYEAVKFENNLAAIDYEKCRDCGACANLCPKEIITAPKKEKVEEPFDESEYFSLETAEEN
ncbi:MAG: 4Fe-4S binding protein [Oscillospiraceae bacterium]|nr:4Fe-4S binding protein [Oscillospiraceae bacterium]